MKLLDLKLTALIQGRLVLMIQTIHRHTYACKRLGLSNRVLEQCFSTTTILQTSKLFLRTGSIPRPNVWCHHKTWCRGPLLVHEPSSWEALFGLPSVFLCQHKRKQKTKLGIGNVNWRTAFKAYWCLYSKCLQKERGIPEGGGRGGLMQLNGRHLLPIFPVPAPALSPLPLFIVLCQFLDWECECFQHCPLRHLSLDWNVALSVTQLRFPSETDVLGILQRLLFCGGWPVRRKPYAHP